MTADPDTPDDELDQLDHALAQLEARAAVMQVQETIRPVRVGRERWSDVILYRTLDGEVPRPIRPNRAQRRRASRR